MPISYSEMQDSALQGKIALYGVKEFVNVKVDSTITQQLPFPADYEFSSCFLPKKFIKLADRIQNFKVRSDDIWILTFPKSGTVWTHKIAWELLNNLSLTTDILNQNISLLEKSMMNEENEKNKNDDEFQKTMTFQDQRFNGFENLSSPRIFMSHLPAHFLPKDIWTVKPKMFCVNRNVKDVAISMYHMFKNHKHLRYPGTMENFFDDFLNDRVIYSPYHSHVNGYRKLSHLDHLLFMNYDEMVDDTFAGIKRISQFLDCTYSDDQLRQLTEHVSFRNMQNNSRDHHEKHGFSFFRKGKSAGYHDEMSPEYIQKFDEWEQKQSLKH